MKKCSKDTDFLQPIHPITRQGIILVDMSAERYQEQKNDVQTEIPLSDAALTYASQGWPVFPLAGKIPYEGTIGHKEATTDETLLTQAWIDHPKANIGLATGRVSGVIVLDMDLPEGYYALKALQEHYGTLPDTRRSRTANGGLHYFFSYPDDGNTYPNVVGLTGHIGIDIRGHGGYVVLPPSRLYGRKYYTWANLQTPLAPVPDWLQKLLPTKGEHRQFPQGLGFASSSGEKWLAEAVAGAIHGNRNAMGFWLACQLRDDGLTQEHATTLLLVYANRVPQEHSTYSSQEALASVKSAYSRPRREPATKRERR